MNINTKYEGKTLLRDWWKIVKSNFGELEAWCKSHRDAPELNHANKSVKRKHIEDSAVGSDQIEDFSISADKLAQYSVSAAKIYPSAVMTAHIRDANVTTNKIADANITEKKIANGAVTDSKIAYDTKIKMINAMSAEDTYSDTDNDMSAASTGPLFRIYSSKYADITGAPPDNSAGENGYIEYLTLQIQMDKNERVQIALNLNSHRKFIRRIVSGTSGEWTEI